MPITSRWENFERTVLHIIFEKGWTQIDYLQAESEMHKLLQDVNWQVHMIVDMQAVRAFPGSTALSEIMREIATAPERPGLIVMVGASRVLQLVFRTMQRLTPELASTRIRFVDSFDEAQRVLRSVINLRQSLKDPAFAADFSEI